MEEKNKECVGQSFGEIFRQSTSTGCFGGDLNAYLTFAVFGSQPMEEMMFGPSQRSLAPTNGPRREGKDSLAWMKNPK